MWLNILTVGVCLLPIAVLSVTVILDNWNVKGN
jgi:hypothetical protein